MPHTRTCTRTRTHPHPHTRIPARTLLKYRFTRSLGFFVGTASVDTLGPSWDPDPEFVRQSSMFVVLERLDSTLRVRAVVVAAAV